MTIQEEFKQDVEREAEAFYNGVVKMKNLQVLSTKKIANKWITSVDKPINGNTYELAFAGYDYTYTVVAQGVKYDIVSHLGYIKVNGLFFYENKEPFIKLDKRGDDDNRFFNVNIVNVEKLIEAYNFKKSCLKEFKQDLQSEANKYNGVINHPMIDAVYQSSGYDVFLTPQDVYDFVEEL